MVQMPDVRNTIRDEKNDITYDVLAYRKLNYAELVQAVRVYDTTRTRKTKLQNGMTVTIVSTIGH